MTPSEAKKLLLAGSRRFRENSSLNPNRNQERISAISTGQSPFAAILGCSDSRVPPEIIFDRGVGDIFVIRTAGHLPCSGAKASIEYAVTHLNAPLLVVLAHSKCGAVTASLNHSKGSESECMEKLLNGIYEGAELSQDDTVDSAVRKHCVSIVEKLKREPFIEKRISAGTLEVIPWYYSLDDASVSEL